MSVPCKKCDPQPDDAAGNAAARTEFCLSTMYDHMDSFSEFKESKAKAKELRTKKEELLKFNQKFTNLSLGGKPDEELDKFSTQEIAKFRSSIRQGLPQCQSEITQPVDLWKEMYELKPAASLTTISRTPVRCPVSKCGRTIGATSVLSHFLRDHNEDLVVECQNLYAGDRSILLFNSDMFKFGESACLGLLSYGGVKEVLESRPALRGICKQNSFLSKSHAHLENHLPVLVMVCLTSLAAMLEDKKLAKELINPDDKSKQILVVWLVSVQTTKPIHCTVTAFDEGMTSSRSTIIRVRSMEASQNPEDFLASDTDYLMMNQGELDILSEDGAKSVYLEIKIHEFAT